MRWFRLVFVLVLIGGGLACEPEEFYYRPCVFDSEGGGGYGGANSMGGAGGEGGMEAGGGGEGPRPKYCTN